MELTHRQIFNLYVRQLPSGNRRSLACKYSRCSYPSAFRTEEEAVQHVTSAHLNQSWEGFVCLTCGVLMARKQDAVRHVKTMNAGKKYECAVW
ncbi:hypothetical protein Clacol_005836 [Clathrus columnatus]|uniref:C2H2-type domain-containing protein n=1 Tax=Clathrus columnatus TaxID=1419009 RepID=A0AAV5AGI9_9AGAM|nr:hypothetical protein Clacol_005836 [Clathrus columnatus]